MGEGYMQPDNIVYKYGIHGGTVEEAVDNDPINPDYYTRFAITPTNFIMANNLDFPTGCVIKYVCRAPYKGCQIDDLRKARKYINMLIAKAEGKSVDFHERQE